MTQPTIARRKLSEEPSVHESAVVQGDLGRWTIVGPRTQIIESVLGDYSYITGDCQVAYAEIGKFCSIASHVRINPGNHPLWRATLHHFSYRSVAYQLGDNDDDGFFEWRREHKVILGDDVWIGHGAIVLPGIRIGTGAAVGAGAVVTKDVPPFTIVAGVPASVIRRRVDPETEAALMRIRWWDWTHGELRAALNDFRTLNAEEFAKKYDPMVG